MNRAASFVCATALACSMRARTPEMLRDRYLQAVRTDDPRAAYALLSPRSQAALPYANFEQRWREQASDRAALVQTANTQPLQVRKSGVTHHRNGQSVQWTEVDGRFVASAGVPWHAARRTPADAVTALIAALRRGDTAELTGLLAPSLVAAQRAAMLEQTEALQAALREGAFAISHDGQRAELRYGVDRMLVLEHAAHGWQVLAF